MYNCNKLKDSSVKQDFEIVSHCATFNLIATSEAIVEWNLVIAGQLLSVHWECGLLLIDL